MATTRDPVCGYRLRGSESWPSCCKRCCPSCRARWLKCRRERCRGTRRSKDQASTKRSKAETKLRTRRRRRWIRN
eukprot:3389986-Prymnesium_polylepis.1